MNGLIWYNYLQLKSKNYINNHITIDYIKCVHFFLKSNAVHTIYLLIYITLSPATCTIETFIRKVIQYFVQSWDIRSTMSDKKFDGQCTISVGLLGNNWV